MDFARRCEVLPGETIPAGYFGEGALVCRHDPGAYSLVSWANDPPLAQFTTCGGCGTELASYAKHAVCAFCGKGVYLT